MAYPIASVTRPSVLLNLTNGKLPDSALVAVPGGRLVAPAARAYLAMLDAAEKDGITIDPTSSADTFRPYSVQERIFKERYRKGVKSKIDTVGRVWNGERWFRHQGAAAAVPGTSNHGWGLAVDIANASGKRLEWLLKNAQRFGFSWEIQSEPWHLRYVEGDTPPPAVLAFERGTAPAPVAPVPAPAPNPLAAIGAAIKAAGEYVAAHPLDSGAGAKGRPKAEHDAVFWAQMLLGKRLGWDEAKTKAFADGVYGDLTKWNIAVFQNNCAAMFKLPPTALLPRGRVASDTWFWLAA